MNFTVIQRIKNRTYLITFVTREPRQIVGFDIAYDKSENRIQNIADNAVKARFYFSDANPSYQSVSYFGKHFYFHNKSHTFTVEGVNSDIRKYISALQRNSKCFFHSLNTFKSVMNIFVYSYNKFAQYKFLFPKFKKSDYLIDFISYLLLGHSLIWVVP